MDVRKDYPQGWAGRGLTSAGSLGTLRRLSDQCRWSLSSVLCCLSGHTQFCRTCLSPLPPDRSLWSVGQWIQSVVMRLNGFPAGQALHGWLRLPRRTIAVLPTTASERWSDSREWVCHVTDINMHARSISW